MELIDLPPEKIVEICEGLDTSTLNRFMLTNKYMKDLCQETLNKRKETEKEFWTEIIPKLEQGYKFFIEKKISDFLESEIYIEKTVGGFGVIQMDYDLHWKLTIPNIPWVLAGFESYFDERVFNYSITRIAILQNYDQLMKAIQIIKDKGYHRIQWRKELPKSRNINTGVLTPLTYNI